MNYGEENVPTIRPVTPSSSCDSFFGCQIASESFIHQENFVLIINKDVYNVIRIPYTSSARSTSLWKMQRYEVLADVFIIRIGLDFEL